MDGGGAVSEVTRTRPKARKRHACEVCPVPIEPGDVYVRSITFYDGTVSVWKTCQACTTATDEAWCAGYEDGDFITADSVREWADEYQWTDQVAADLMERLDWKEATNDHA